MPQTAYAQPVLEGFRVTLRPPGASELDSLADSIAADPETSPWWGSDADKVRHWLHDPESTVFVIDVDGEAAGIVQYEEENDPDYRFAGMDISLLGPWIGMGYGSDALRTLARYLFDVRGHHRIHIDPAAVNARAIKAYEAVGFKPVGVMRSYERGPDGVWRDGLLMDMLAGELTKSSSRP